MRFNLPMQFKDQSGLQGIRKIQCRLSGHCICYHNLVSGPSCYRRENRKIHKVLPGYNLGYKGEVLPKYFPDTFWIQLDSRFDLGYPQNIPTPAHIRPGIPPEHIDTRAHSTLDTPRTYRHGPASIKYLITHFQYNVSHMFGLNQIIVGQPGAFGCIAAPRQVYAGMAYTLNETHIYISYFGTTSGW